MAIKNTNIGGTDWVDGDILTHTDLNDTFDATITRKIYIETLTGSNLSTSANSYTTLWNVDISSEANLYSFNFKYHLTMITGATYGGYIQLLVTFTDSTTATVSLGSMSPSAYKRFIGSYYSVKQIESVEVQAYTNLTGTITLRAMNEESSLANTVYITYLEFY